MYGPVLLPNPLFSELNDFAGADRTVTTNSQDNAARFQVKTFAKSMMMASNLEFRKQDSLLIFAWWTKKPIAVLSTIHQAETVVFDNTYHWNIIGLASRSGLYKHFSSYTPKYEDCQVEWLEPFAIKCLLAVLAVKGHHLCMDPFFSPTPCFLNWTTSLVLTEQSLPTPKIMLLDFKSRLLPHLWWWPVI